MKYNLENSEDKTKAEEYFNKLVGKECFIELKQLHHNRSLSQNSYIHSLLSAAALAYGEDLEYFKQIILKRYIARDIFESKYVNPVSGEERIDWRSTSEISTLEMSVVVEKLKNWASKELGILLPDASNAEGMMKIENSVENNKRWL